MEPGANPGGVHVDTRVSPEKVAVYERKTSPPIPPLSVQAFSGPYDDEVAPMVVYVTPEAPDGADGLTPSTTTTAVPQVSPGGAWAEAGGRGRGEDEEEGALHRNDFR
jgi:hypothetical protein